MPNLSAAANCTRCNGTGEYHGTRRDGSSYISHCFACQGGGYRFRRRAYAAQAADTAPTAFEARMDAMEAVMQPAPVSLGAKWDRFAAAMPAQAAWLLADTSAFAASLVRAVCRYGNLTPRQLACVDRNLTAVFPTLPAATAATDEPDHSVSDAIMARAIGTGMDGQPVTEAQVLAGTPISLASLVPVRPAYAPPPPPVVIDASNMRLALLTARNSGLRRPRLTLGLFEFRLGRVATDRAETIYVYTRANIRTTSFTYAGAILAVTNIWRPYAGQTMTDAQMDLIRDAGTNPRNAAAAHGHDTTHCSCCRRLLTDPPSVMAGIGPVCIQRFGWSF